MKLLLAEDERELSDALTVILTHSNYLVDAVYTGTDALDYLQVEHYDGVILDVMMPGMDGFEVCRKVREKSQVPIIMLTALSDEENQLRGFEQQIDDYIPKPFSPRILLCKIAAILRRRTAENQNPSLLTYKELSMDVDGFHVYQGGNEVVLTSKEFALLRLMLENQGKVFTRQMLLDRLWADDLEVEDRIVDSQC